MNLDRNHPFGLEHLSDVDDRAFVIGPVLFVLQSDGRFAVEGWVKGTLKFHLFVNKDHKTVEILAIVSLDITARKRHIRGHMSFLLLVASTRI